jgi:hypothetical protein
VNNYLQRMALSALQPGGNIRPILDPLFSPARDRSQAESLWIEKNDSVAEGDGPRAPAGPEAHFVPPAPPGTDPDPAVPPSQKPVIERTKPVLLEPLLPQRPILPVRHTTIAEPTISAEPATPGRREIDREVAIPKSEDQGEEAKTTQPSRQEQPYDPFAAPRSSSLKPIRIFPTRQPAATRSASLEPTGISPIRESAPAASGLDKKQPKIVRAQRPEPSVREPDEIEIHIGRIEVTAVHPSAPQPVSARSPRPGPSLDEYLRRRDRRTL